MYPLAFTMSCILQNGGHDFFRHSNEALPVFPKDALKAIRAVEDGPSSRVANVAAVDFVGRSFLHTVWGIQRLVIVVAYQSRKKGVSRESVQAHRQPSGRHTTRRALSTMSIKLDDLQKLLSEPINVTDDASDDEEDISINPPAPAVIQPHSCAVAAASVINASSRMIGFDFILR
jgi:hypothetical protein